MVVTALPLIFLIHFSIFFWLNHNFYNSVSLQPYSKEHIMALQNIFLYVYCLQIPPQFYYQWTIFPSLFEITELVSLPHHFESYLMQELYLFMTPQDTRKSYGLPQNWFLMPHLRKLVHVSIYCGNQIDVNAWNLSQMDVDR